jgi:hypothetical protein
MPGPNDNPNARRDIPCACLLRSIVSPLSLAPMN